MNKHTKIYLGFINEQEGYLYEDTCFGYLKPETVMQNHEETLLISKNDCLKIIKDNELDGLLESLKGLSRVNRFKVINTYYGNMATLASKMMLRFQIEEWNNDDDPIKENEELKEYYRNQYIIANRIQEQIITLVAQEFTNEEKKDYLAYSRDLLNKKDNNKIR